MSLKRTTEPTELPIAIEEVKDHIRWESAGGDEAQIALYMRSAVQQMDGAEGLLNRALVTQTWELTLDDFPAPHRRWPTKAAPIKIPLPPLQSITSLQYIDTAGTLQTWSSSNYKVLNVDSPTRGGLIEPAFGEVWPSTRHESENVTITFICGYGTRESVPEPIRHLLLFAVADAYDGRSPVDAKPWMRTPAYQGLFQLARYLVSP